MFPGTECTATAKEGVVRSGDIFEAESGDFILCRNNYPLVATFIMLLEKERKHPSWDGILEKVFAGF